MLSRCRRRLGGFVVYPNVVPDWRQFFSRDDAHVAAKARLDELTNSTDAAAAPPLSADEANQLVETLTRSHNAPALADLIRTMRENLNMDLKPSHYHALMRVFNFDRDKENLERTISVMVEREVISHEMFARIIDGLHCLGSVDVLTRILEVVALGQAHYGSLATTATVDADRCVAAASTASSSSSPSEESNKRVSSPILSSLLHHLTHDVRYPPYLPVLVGVWMRSINVVLSDWDWVNILTALLSKPQQFLATRAIIAYLEDSEPGYAKLASLIQQINRRAELTDSTVAVVRLITRINEPLDTYWKSVDCGFVNLRIPLLLTTVDRILETAVLRERGIGVEQRNPLPLIHTMALVHSILRDDATAVSMIAKAQEWATAWEKRYSEASTTSSTEAVKAEGFEFHPHFLMDMGNLFPRCSGKTLKSIASAYSSIADKIATSASDVDVTICGAFGIALIRSDVEAKQAWDHILSSVDATATRVPHSVRMLVKKFVEFCSRHPQRNCKMTPNGLAERRKWGLYLESRDTSLALFGTGKQGRDSMQHLFYHNGQQQPLRNSEMISKDVDDVCRIFSLTAPTKKEKESSTKTPMGGAPDLKINSEPFSRFPRLTPSTLQLKTDAIPRHLYDTTVPNPYPHCHLRRDPLQTDEITHDFFVDVWNALMSSTSGTGLGAQHWYLKDPEMYMGLMHCLIQRLDWEAAAQLTMRATKNFEFTHLMDSELQAMFYEIGDPVGSIVFKTATKLYDGRIQDVPSKRDVFQSKITGGGGGGGGGGGER